MPRFLLIVLAIASLAAPTSAATDAWPEWELALKRGTGDDAVALKRGEEDQVLALKRGVGDDLKRGDEDTIA